jgi:hypothetical protein
MPIVSGKDRVMQKPTQTASHSPNHGTLSNTTVKAMCNTCGFINHHASHRPSGSSLIDVEYDGGKTLLEQQAEINFDEQTNRLQLLCYHKGITPMNSATVKQVPQGQTILPLLLLEIPASTSMGSEVAAQLLAGRHLVFYTVVHVKGAETKVAGFR